MKVLFDNNVPSGLRSLLAGHSVSTAREMLWDQLTDGLLMRVAEEAGFTVMITADKNIRKQQNLSLHRIALVVLETPKWESVERNALKILAAVGRAKVQSYELVQFDVDPSR